jgi:hypothetical protein
MTYANAPFTPRRVGAGSPCAEAICGPAAGPPGSYPLVGRALALRDRLTAADAMYVALTETLGLTLVTRDARLARAGGHRARVELV